MASDVSSTDLEVLEINSFPVSEKMHRHGGSLDEDGDGDDHTDVYLRERASGSPDSYDSQNHILGETIHSFRRLDILEPTSAHPNPNVQTFCGTNRVARGRGKWSAAIRKVPSQVISPDPGHCNGLESDGSVCSSTSTSTSTRDELDTSIPRGRGRGKGLRTPGTSPWFEETQLMSDASHFKSSDFDPNPIKNAYGSSQRRLLNGIKANGHVNVNGRDKDPDTDRGLENVAKEAIGESMDQVLAVKEKLTEVYVPDAPLEGDALFIDRKEKRYRTGLNFAAYERIPVMITSNGEEISKHNVECFEDLKLNQLILENVSRAGYNVPTPIQKNACPYIMEQKDVMACAQTGSGKTAGYLLPIIHSLIGQNVYSFQPNEPRAVILCPTRELSFQIRTEANLYSYGTGIKTRIACGGISICYQKNIIKDGCNILIATPGRLLHFLEEGTINLKKVQFFVLDEGDKMLEMGFMGDVRRIEKFMRPKGERVSAMFSATFPYGIQKAAEDFLKDHVFIAIGTVGGACNDIQQIVYKVDRADRRRKLMEIFDTIKVDEKILIFCRTKQGADYLAAYLSQLKISTTSLHGDRLQSQRDLALKEFIQGKRQVLVATAVAARGLDIPKVSVVINFDLPDTIDEYVHRIGRTGRVGNLGKAISFFVESTDDDLMPKLREILRDANQDVPEWMLDNHKLKHDQVFRRRFGATDRRMGTKNFTSYNGVPDPIEVEEDGWE